MKIRIWSRKNNQDFNYQALLHFDTLFGPLAAKVLEVPEEGIAYKVATETGVTVLSTTKDGERRILGAYVDGIDSRLDYDDSEEIELRSPSKEYFKEIIESLDQSANEGMMHYIQEFP